MRLLSICLFCIAWFWVSIVQAQTREIDSLKNVVARLGDDSSKVNTLIALSSQYLSTDLQEAIRYGGEAVSLAEQISYKKGEAYGYKAIGLGNITQGNFPEAAVQFEHSLAVFEEIGLKVGIANMLSNLGVVYFNGGDDSKAIDYYLRALKIAEEVDDKLRIATLMNNIGGVYNNKPATELKALDYFLRAIPIFKEVDNMAGMATASMNAGEIHMKQKQYDSASIFFKTSLAFFDNSIDATFPMTYLGEIRGKQHDFKGAYAYHEQAIRLAEKLDAKLELGQSIIGMAKTQALEGRVLPAIDTYMRAKTIVEGIAARKEQKETYEGLADLYARHGDFRSAYQYVALLASVKDSLYNEDNTTKIQQALFNFELGKKEAEIDLLTKDRALQKATIQRQRIANFATGITLCLLLLLLIGFYNRHQFTQRTNKIIKSERDRSKELLLNILPAETARELETNGHAQARFYDNATVLFADFKGFTSIARSRKPQELVAELNEYFIAFDDIVERFKLEKIKTIGDAYMCAGGIPTPDDTHPRHAIQAGLAMQQYITAKNVERAAKGLDTWELRIGIHVGPIVAGVVGKKKYAYDIWGDTVNIASRMESSSESGRVNISSTLYMMVQDHYNCTYRGKIYAKNIGEVDMYFVESGKTQIA
ncbi:adenylate/guanylate cyclase domain-containing protein [Chryseolinea sp. T2]|uniref:adenylate/guanylate cyclase domain-containing protein n=1 Tax=Chryseolinea sp. T2 TaxID=3129255 RepID=UPI0030772D2B